MGIGYIILIAFGAYAALKFYRTQQQIQQELISKGVASPGVSVYPPVPVTHRIQQVQAYEIVPACTTVSPTYAPAFGPVENMPTSCQEIMIP